ncbi:uncharacterized protein DFL_003086 [Arthrobotrys flagrans]|uniref:Uncharacterized protein n=1 Tax=Arthrobotrys flagrans TaxID=97331 RepID=A0A437ACJ6_ARTFL|nr:hypothetical protein DFL_003086 [Arthrobotrys flagrans]
MRLNLSQQIAAARPREFYSHISRPPTSTNHALKIEEDNLTEGQSKREVEDTSALWRSQTPAEVSRYNRLSNSGNPNISHIDTHTPSSPLYIPYLYPTIRKPCPHRTHPHPPPQHPPLPHPPSHLKSQLERDLTTIRKRIRRAKSHSIPPTTIISIIDKIKQLADIYANTAMAYVTAGSTAEVYAISAGALERLMRVEAELRRVDGEEGGNCENPYAETVGGRFELMGVPDLTGRRKERYDVFQHGNKSLGNLEVKNVAAARKPAVPIHHNHVPEKEVVVKDPYARVRATPANERLVKMKRK